MKTDVSFSIKVNSVSVGWKYTYWISLTFRKIIKGEVNQDYIYNITSIFLLQDASVGNTLILYKPNQTASAQSVLKRSLTK